MAFYIIKRSNILTISSGTAQVSSADTYQSGYPFSNVYTYWEQPWKEWRSGSSDSTEHKITLNFSGTANHLAVLGANFSVLNHSLFQAILYPDGELNQSAYILSRNQLAGDYRLCADIASTSPITLTIPAQETDEGYFKIGAIVLANGAATTFTTATYPKYVGLRQPAEDINIQSGLAIKQKTGRKHHIIELRNKMRSRAYVDAVNAIKVGEGISNPFIYYETTTADQPNVYMVRRLPDMTYTERGNKNSEYVIRMEEVA